MVIILMDRHRVLCLSHIADYLLENHFQTAQDWSRLAIIRKSVLFEQFSFFMCSFGKLWECPVQSSGVLCGREHVANLKNPPRFFLAA